MKKRLVSDCGSADDIRTRYNRLSQHALRPSFLNGKLKRVAADLRTEGYYSQYGQDRWIAETVLPGKQAGVFVDVGAHDGVRFSNTLFLERQLNWTGLAIEPLVDVYERLVSNRTCATIRGCIAPTAGIGRFQAITGYGEMLSGLASERHPLHVRRIGRELRRYGGELNEVDVPCYRLADVLADHNIEHVDYLSIDVEGAEYSILNSLDFGRLSITVIGVENNYQDPRLPELLSSAGYEFHSIVGDEFYLKTNRCLCS